MPQPVPVPKTMAKIVWVLVPLMGLAALGYWFSDARSLDTLAHRQRLDSPERVFGYVTGDYQQAFASDPVLPGESVQTMLAPPSRRLWCDEGAIVLSLLNQRLHRNTRLVDLLDQRTGISHHTTLQIQEGGRWITYDFTSKRWGIPLAATVSYQAIPRYRSYPSSPLHWLLLHNNVARAVVQRYRGITS